MTVDLLKLTALIMIICLIIITIALGHLAWGW